MLNVNFIIRQSRCFLHLKHHAFKSDLKSKLLIGWFNSRSYHRNTVLHEKIQPSGSAGKDSNQNSSNEGGIRRNRYVQIGAASLILSGSLFAIYFTRSKKKSEKAVQISEVPVRRIPANSKDIPKKIPYLLIGGGPAAFSAFRAIKSNDVTAKVLLVSNELYNPYMRPPLTKEMWFQDKDITQNLKFKQWNGTERSLFFEPDEYYVRCENIENEPKGGVSIAKGWTVTKLDHDKKKAILDDGTEIEYDKCLIATGIRPNSLPVFGTENLKNKVTVFRNIDDFKNLYEVIENGAKKLAIIGGSFLGSELACSISKNGESNVNVVQIFPEKGNLAKVLPEYLSNWTTAKIREQGVEIINYADVDTATLSSNGKQVALQLSNGRKLTVDHVVVAAGSVANTDLAESSGFETDPELGGVLVNSELAVRTDLYAAGDCACFYDSQLGRRRIEHHDHAITSGRLAGENMTGAKKPYTHQSMFWSDLGPNVAFEAIGVIDSRLPTVAVYTKPSNESSKQEKNSDSEENKNDSKTETNKLNISTSLPKEGEDYSKGVIFYLRNDVIVGIVLWNIFNRIIIARQVLQQRKKFDDLNEVAKLFEMYTDEQSEE